ncbi:aminotransferase class IV [Candidatus Lariskella endosymbiont of Epinotia ramella]|uniref:aminotransferase class IV n=1 Tax=Candidatus Lariskella endosymbiont of Epinotia ramella TaxID=3066224 RepID=UPI0030CB70CA
MQILSDLFQGKCWLNGKILYADSANISIFNHSLHYSGAIFEGIRTYNYVPFKLQEHMERFQQSASMMGYTLPYSVLELNSAVLHIIKENDLKSGYIRPVAWRGPETQTIYSKKCSIQTAILGWRAFDDAKEYTKNSHELSIEISTWRKISKDMVPIQAKASGLYMMNTIAKNDAVSRGFDDAIMLDIDDFITEATTSNFFYVKDDVLYTPIADSFLDGITRRTVLELAKNCKIQSKEVRCSMSDVESADAAFLTGTAMGITPIREIYYYKNKKLTKLNINNKVMLELIAQYNLLTTGQLCNDN